MNKIFKIINMFIFLLVFLVITGCGAPVENNEKIRINEVCLNNTQSIATEDNYYLDWIELYNYSDEDIHLKDYGISDSKKDLYRYTFPSVYIKAKDYLIVYFEVDSKSTEKLIANFGLSEFGEKLYLSMPNTAIISEVEVPELEENSTYGYYNDNGKETLKRLNPTPKMNNESKPLFKKIEEPVFSKESGVYSDKFDLSISQSENIDIYYTLDCSEPTTDSLLYKDEISVINPSNNPNIINGRDDIGTAKKPVTSLVDKMFVIRAVAISDDGNKSNVVTKSYYIGNKYKDKKVVSLVSDYDNLLGYENGIYVKGKKYDDTKNSKTVQNNWDITGRISERDCNFTYLENGDFTISQDCGMRIHGYGGRTNMYKSFNIYARSCYGNQYFTDPLFDNVPKTKSFILKYDRYSAENERFRDGFLQSLVKDRDITTQEYEQCILFINGEYMNEYSLMEKYSDDYFEAHYGVNKDNVTIIKDDTLEAGSIDDYNELKNFAKTKDLSNNKNYESFCKLVDIQSLIDFYAIEIYINNFDFSYRKNYLLWKTDTKENNNYGDGKWRWILYDLDVCATSMTMARNDVRITYDYKFDTFTGDFLFAGDLKDDIFFSNLMKNKNFREAFEKSFKEIANNNFNYQNVISKAKLEYNYTTGKLDTFFKNRYDSIINHLNNYLNKF